MSLFTNTCLSIAVSAPRLLHCTVLYCTALSYTALYCIADVLSRVRLLRGPHLAAELVIGERERDGSRVEGRGVDEGKMRGGRRDEMKREKR